MDSDTEALDEERDAGKAAARALAEHLSRMGAAAAELPVSLDDGDYLIKVTRHRKGSLEIPETESPV